MQSDKGYEDSRGLFMPTLVQMIYVGVYRLLQKDSWTVIQTFQLLDFSLFLTKT